MLEMTANGAFWCMDKQTKFPEWVSNHIISILIALFYNIVIASP